MKKRKTYTPEFKAQVVASVKAGKSVAAVAKTHKVTPKSVASWVKASKPQSKADRQVAKRATFMEAYGGKPTPRKPKKTKVLWSKGKSFNKPSPTDKIARLEKALAKSEGELKSSRNNLLTSNMRRAELLDDVNCLKAAIRVLSN